LSGAPASTSTLSLHSGPLLDWKTSGSFDTRVPYPLATALSISTTLSYLSFRAKPRNLQCASIPPRFPRANLPPIATEPICPPMPLFLSPDTCCSLGAKPTCPGVPWIHLRSADLSWNCFLTPVQSSPRVRPQNKTEPHIPTEPLHVIRPPRIVVQTKMQPLRKIRLLSREINR
jgi:hypothetical protein